MNVDDKTYRRRYFSIVAKCLREGIENQFNPNELSREDQDVVEYFLKDVSRSPVKESAGRTDCIDDFAERIDLLCECDESEWIKFHDEIIFNSNVLNPSDITAFELLEKLMLEKPVAV